MIRMVTVLWPPPPPASWKVTKKSLTTERPANGCDERGTFHCDFPKSAFFMTFLAPLALIGALLLILPIVVHLFKPRKMKQTPFSSLRWLKQTHQRLSRRIQWHQWLLFLLRAGCILLLVLALAKPLIGFWGSQAV